MPIYTDVSPLYRMIVVVARGLVSVEEVIECFETLTEPKIRSYAKILDVTGLMSEVTREQVDLMAIALRGRPDAQARGPLAVVVDPARRGFAEVFANATSDDRPVKIFESIHVARRWLMENLVERPMRPFVRSHSAEGRPGVTPPSA